MWLEDISSNAANCSDALTGNAPPVLKEITALLEQLNKTGEGGCIDLASLPFSSADRKWLIDALGEGPVKININAGGPTTIVETASPGVWWVVHHNEQNTQTGEFIEVSLVPEIVPSHPDDVYSGIKKLKDRLTT